MKATLATIVAVTVTLVAVGVAGAVPAKTTVGVTMSEFKYVLSKRSVPRGLVVFRVRNVGDTGHDFKIAGKKTPIYAPGKGGPLSVTFRKAGRYPYLCAVPGHARLGMKGVLVVK